jgi:hypothetical protein
MLNYELDHFLEKLPHMTTPVILSVTFQPADKSRASEAPPRVIVAVGSKAMAQANPIIRGGPAADLLTLIPKALYEFAKTVEATRKKPSKSGPVAEKPNARSEHGADAASSAKDSEASMERDTPPDFSPAEDAVEAEPGGDGERPAEIKPEPPTKSVTPKGPTPTLFD